MALYPLLPIGIGLALLVWLFRDARSASSLAARGVRAQGEVVGYRETKRSARMIVRFRTDDGREVLATQGNTGWAAAKHGETVTVSYDPHRPEEARIVAGAWLSGWPRGIFTGLGAAMVLIGGLMGAFAWG
ncbi:hypothetical protein HDA32_004687 [Spinactinospora alkalitolerans]|uniref:DUF3592 domain-containing protein n=1 Tax=Spinactinospora alkalitolerans TaxID=687207 RepID=A0A852U1V1_9ACTN|nr:DUF3592 domain-containing protein [Spinactinospora alkalitolerans]NYE49567.1 hypothetical protein [Spinactinospora alkalitolerans]